MRRLLIAAFASLLAVALIAPAAQGATKVRHLQPILSPAPLQPGVTPQSGGELALDVIFKNTRTHRKRFTPRLVSLIHLEDVPLLCMKSPSGYATTTFLTTTEAPMAKLTKAPYPNGRGGNPKVKPYNFAFAFSPTTFTGTIEGRVYKPRSLRDKALRTRGTFTVDYYDAGSGVTDCWSGGGRSWYWGRDAVLTGA